MYQYSTFGTYLVIPCISLDATFQTNIYLSDPFEACIYLDSPFDDCRYL